VIAAVAAAAPAAAVAARIVGRGSRVRSVYRLADGRLVYVQGP
jgi:hypothetical protein